MIDSDIFIHLFLTDIILMIYNYLKANITQIRTCILHVSIELRTVSKPSTAASERHLLVMHCRHMSSQILCPGEHQSTKVAYVHPVKTY